MNKCLATRLIQVSSWGNIFFQSIEDYLWKKAKYFDISPGKKARIGERFWFKYLIHVEVSKLNADRGPEKH